MFNSQTVQKTLIQTLASQLSSTLMQLLFWFDKDTRVEKTVIQTLACQLLSTLMQFLFLLIVSPWLIRTRSIFLKLMSELPPKSQLESLAKQKTEDVSRIHGNLSGQLGK